MEMKVLATLWKYQKSQSPGSRWTFTVMTGSPEHIAFSTGFLWLFKKGLADLAPNGHVQLTDLGISFAERHNEELARWADTYDKFSN
jgi:hypothetical protein